MKHGRYAAVLAAALVAASVTQVRAAPSSASAKQVMLVVDVDGLEGALAGRVGGALDEQLRDALRDEGVAVVGDGVESTIEVRVDMPNVELRTYAISVAVIVDGEREVVADAVPCPACNEARVVELALEQLPEAVTRVSEPAVAPAPVIEPEAPVEVDRGQRLDLGPVGFAGAATIVGGLATVGAGALVLTLPPSVTNAGRIGGALAIAGGAAALLGAAALVVDLQVLGPRRRHFADVHVSVDVSPTNAGLWMTGSF